MNTYGWEVLKGALNIPTRLDGDMGSGKPGDIPCDKPERVDNPPAGNMANGGQCASTAAVGRRPGGHQ